MEKKIEKVLVAGGAGFLGYHLIKHLSKAGEYKIDVVDNFSRGRRDPEFESMLKQGNIRLIEADLTDPKFYNLLDTDYDYIYALAAIVGVKNVTNRPDETLYVNISLALNLLEWLKGRNKSLKRLLFASTSEVYAGTIKHYNAPVPTDEKVNIAMDDISLARTTYALSKVVGESACFNYSARYKIPFTIVRYHNIYGPRMGTSHVIPELLLRAKESKRYLDVYSVNHTRAFCFITDAIRATIRLAESADSLNKIFNVGNSDNEITIGDLAKIVIKTTNPTLKIKPLDDDKRSPERRCPDISKLKEIINFKPKVTLGEGIELTWKWYKNNYNGGPKVIHHV